MKKKIVSCLLVAVMCTLIGSVAYADESGSEYRADNIKSHGTLQYEQAGADNNVLIASQDLNYLADEIDELEDSYKRTATDSLAVIGQTPAGTLWSDICSAIEHSQDVSTGTTADNLSKDKGAWVNGEYIIGNGADNKTNYNQGYTDGFNKAMNGASISYVYHRHSGSQSGAGSGCYSGYHVHNGGCPTHIEYEQGECGCTQTVTHSTTGKCVTCNHEGHGGYCYMPVNKPKEVSDCDGSSYNAWCVVCGKTEGVTIESATITFP